MKKHENDDAFEVTEQTILALLQELQTESTPQPAQNEPTEEPLPTEKTALPLSPNSENDADQSAALFRTLLDVAEDDDEEEEESPAPAPRPKKRRRTDGKRRAPKVDSDRVVGDVAVEKPAAEKNLLARAAGSIFPQKSDPASEIVRKCVFLLSLLVFLCSLGFLLYYMVIEPRRVQNDTARYEKLYTDTATIEETTSGYNYPAGMQATFRRLYDVNRDIAGWLSYSSNDAAKFLNINQPVVHCDNNDTYLSHAFDGSKSRSGTLFLDKNNTVERNMSNRVSIIYGHNMASGMMFAKLNKLLGNVYYARSAPLIHFNTIYENNQYKVFAVIVSDEGADAERYYGYLRTAFADDNDFMNYVAELRARSLYDYPVDVSATDELLILSTCTNKSQVKVADGRMAVIARRVRDNEDTQVNTASITDNADVIMPYAWYTAQGLTPHVFYTETDYHLPDAVGTTAAATVATTAATTVATTTAATDEATPATDPTGSRATRTRTTTTAAATTAETTTAETTAATATTADTADVPDISPDESLTTEPNTQTEGTTA